MKFSTEEEKQAYIDNLERMVAEITKVEPHPECPGYTIEKGYVEIAQFCLKLENMIKEVEDREVKVKITGSLRVVEAFYEERLNRRLRMPFVESMDPAWYVNNINLLQQSLKSLNSYAPTARTCELYCNFVEKYLQILHQILDSKTPGHPACIAKYQEKLHATLNAGREIAALLKSPVNMMLPKNPNEPNNTNTVLQFPDEADMPFEDPRDRTFSQ